MKNNKIPVGYPTGFLLFKFDFLNNLYYNIYI